MTILLISIFTGTFAHCRFIWGYWKWSGRFLVQRQTKRNNFTCRKSGYKLTCHSQTSLVIFLTIHYLGCEIAPNTGANVTKFFTLVTKSWELVAKLATRMFHHNLTKRYSELKRFARINLQQTSSLSLFPKCSMCISIYN